MRKPAISKDKKTIVENWYYKKQMPMIEIAKKLDVSIDAVVFFMRKNNLKRRSFSDIQKLRFEKSIPSFKRKKLSSKYLEELAVAGSMLYWAEGSKGNELRIPSTVDLANSDPKMIKLFLRFLRTIYGVDEKKLRIYLYCYADQNINQLEVDRT
jgi:predicted DNA-binding protein YlxM (UPF0122 family)